MDRLVPAPVPGARALWSLWQIYCDDAGVAELARKLTPHRVAASAAAGGLRRVARAAECVRRLKGWRASPS